MTWWQRLWRQREMERQLDKEVRFHVEEHAADLMARGHDAVEARRLARLALGGPEQVKEECRVARGTRWLADLWQDFRYALRMLRQRPGFSAVALLTLALGSGATTVMFTVVNGVLLKPLPFPDPDRLVAVNGRSNNWNVVAFGEQKLAYPDFLDCRRESRSLDLAGWLFNGGTLSDPGDPEYVDLREITAGFFSVLGVPITQGRAFLPEEDRPGGAPVAILGHDVWQRKFGGSADAVGRSLVLNAKRYTIVGIAPADFRLDGEAGIFTPLGQDKAPFLQGRRAHPIGTMARLRPGATIGQAQAELALVGRNLAVQHPDTNRDRTFMVQRLRPNVDGVGSTLWLLMGAVGLVLLIACANVASLLLARALARTRELAMRAALGAGRGRLIRQCLTESAVLGVSGGIFGVALAVAGIRPFVVFWPGSLPRAEEVRLDWRVLLFAVAVSLASGLLFGLAPALRVPARHLEETLRSGGRTLVGNSRRLHGTFVISEIALAVVLLASTGMLGRTLLRVSVLDPGVDVHNVLVTRMALSPGLLANPARTRAAWRDVLERARRVPGVQAAATVDTVPMRQGNNQLGYWTTAELPPPNQQPMALATSITPDYFKVMGIPLRQGRVFNEQDQLDTNPVVVIDEVLAQNAFGKSEAVGKRLWIPDMGPGPFQVAGVVGHVRHWGLAGDDQAQVRAQFYYPFAQVGDPLVRRWSELMSLVVRTSVPPMNLVESLRRELRGAGNDQVLYQVRTMEQLARGTLDLQRFLMLLFGIFAGLSLVLACIGIYGVLAYLTTQRVPEFGVRLALGASAWDVVSLVLRQSLGMILTGVGVGTCAALAAGRLLSREVAGVRSTEPLTLVVTISVLAAAALIASFLPARRAGRVDPLKALRQD